MKLFFYKALRKIIISLFVGILFFSTLFSSQLISPNRALAQDCAYVGQCINNKKCVCDEFCDSVANRELSVGDEDCGSALVGGVEPPAAVGAINEGSGAEIGLIFFLSRLITFVNIVAGILIMLNFVYAGFLYITGASSASNMSKINERLTWSFVGIIVIVGSYTLAAIFGLIFYGEATFIITPVLDGIL